MSNIEIGEGHHQPISYTEFEFDVCLRFVWAESDIIPTAVQVSITEPSRKTNLAATSDSMQKNWATFEEAMLEGRRIATELITNRSWVRQTTGVGSSQVVHRSKD